MSAVLSVIAWYAVGACCALVLVRRGHSASLWSLAATLLGGLVLLALVVSLVRRPSPSVTEVATSAGDPDAPIGHRVAVWVDPLEDGPGLARAIAAVPIRVEEVCLLRRVGFEANSTLIDTGERSLAAEQVRWLHAAPRAAHRRFLASGTTAGIAQAASEMTGALSFHVLRRSRRAVGSRAADLLAATRIPVLVLPDSTMPAPRVRTPRAHRELMA